MASPVSGIDRAFDIEDEPSQPKLTDNGRSVLEARYLKKNEAGECIEQPEALFRRVADTVAEVESEYGASELERRRWSREYYRLMAGGDFLPNSPTLMNAGREMGMLSACFVLPVRDSISEIFDSIKHTALIQKAGGGTGFAFDELRPTGDFIKSSGGTTSGPISFWRAFSEATNAIQQGAFRRGANMGMMYIHHPDILKFLHAKQDLEQFNNYNISVKVTDTWMQDFLDDPDSPHVVRNPRNGVSRVLPKDIKIWSYGIRDLVEIDCVEPLSGENRAAYYKSPRLSGALPEELRGRVYTKRDIWEIIVGNAWKTGEPGVVFIDRINEYNPTPQLGRIEATNPCGEQPLLPYEACNLGSINLGNFVDSPCTAEAEVDWERLRCTIHLATRFLDNVIDANNYPLREIREICLANRKIGLGIMGFADALYKLGVAYDSEQGVSWGARFMQFVNDESHNYSEHLAKTRGCFPNWQGSVWETKRKRMMRNATTTTVAPTGTISIIANCSGGIEPMFSLAFVRNVLRGQRPGDRPLVEVNETFRGVAERDGFLSNALLDRLAREGTLRNIEGVPDELKRVFVCAHDITPDWHMRMQAAFQQSCDSSISKTINFAHDASREDVEKIYRSAFELGCKGVTVYRDGCRELQPMALTKDQEQGAATTAAATKEVSEAATVEVETLVETAVPATKPGNGNGNGNGKGHDQGHVSVTASPEQQSAGWAMPRIEPRDLPEIVSGLRIRQMTPFGNMHVKITVDPRIDRELEVFAQLGKGGDVATSDLEAICRMISLWLRSGGSLRHVIKQLEGIGSSLQIPTRTGRIMSLGDGLATALKKYVRAKERFGLRSLLLGEMDLAELNNPSPPHATTGSTSDRTLQSEPERRPGNGGSTRVPPTTETRTSATAETRISTVAETLANPDRNRLDPPRVSPGRLDNAYARMPASENHATGAEYAPAASAGEFTDTGVAEFSDTGAVAAATLSPAPASVALASAEPRRQHHDLAAHYKLKCPECGGALSMQEGCRKCHSCAWAAC